MGIKNHVHQWVRLSCQVTSGKPPSLPFQETDWELPVLFVWLVTDSTDGWDLGKKKHDLKSCAVSFSQRRFLGFSSHWDPLQDEDICMEVSIYPWVRQCLHLTCVTYKNCTRHWKTLRSGEVPKSQCLGPVRDQISVIVKGSDQISNWSQPLTALHEITRI